ncbi:MAG TPA: DUF3368 domain-containing protein [Candidatus Nanoarchaeia archaeon]|nr:DUF3368 domain-containing protein [Candidatus Nanoarchaeia archaeon]
MIVSNSSPLILLAKINQLKLLKDLFGKVFIPRAVYEEVIVHGKQESYSDAFLLERSMDELIFVRDVKGSWMKEAIRLAKVLGKGESEAILLATQERANLLLIDDAESRKTAQVHKIACRSTPGLLLDAFRKRILRREEYIKNIQLLSEFAWLSGDVVAYFLDQGYIWKGEKK